MQSLTPHQNNSSNLTVQRNVPPKRWRVSRRASRVHRPHSAAWRRQPEPSGQLQHERCQERACGNFTILGRPGHSQPCPCKTILALSQTKKHTGPATLRNQTTTKPEPQPQSSAGLVGNRQIRLGPRSESTETRRRFHPGPAKIHLLGNTVRETKPPKRTALQTDQGMQKCCACSAGCPSAPAPSGPSRDRSHTPRRPKSRCVCLRLLCVPLFWPFFWVCPSFSGSFLECFPLFGLSLEGVFVAPRGRLKDTDHPKCPLLLCVGDSSRKSGKHQRRRPEKKLETPRRWQNEKRDVEAPPRGPVLPWTALPPTTPGFLIWGASLAPAFASEGGTKMSK